MVEIDQLALLCLEPQIGPPYFGCYLYDAALRSFSSSLSDTGHVNSAATLMSATTLVTHALDMAVIFPAAVLAGILILRQRALGYLIAMALLVLEMMLTPLIVSQTIFQLSVGISYATAEIIGPIAMLLRKRAWGIPLSISWPPHGPFRTTSASTSKRSYLAS